MISLIIPCYNEQESLPIFYREVTSVARRMESEYELLFVDDGSKDRTLPILKELAAQDEHVTYFSFPRNFGKEAAMYAGFCNATGDYAAVMDADLQDPPALLPEMAEILGIKERSYQCYEYRERYPDVPGLVAIADFFDVSLDYLVGRSDIRERQ